MHNNIFGGIFDSPAVATISLSNFLLCVGCSLIAGLILAGCYAYRSKFTRSFVACLALLPSVVCIVIMMVNGNVGAGVAVAGAFSLVRFRSVPGTAKEIGAIFLAMAVGLMGGMGYLGYEILSTVLLGAISMLYNCAGKRSSSANRTMRITIPEDLDYTGVFDPIFEVYASSWELTGVKTTNLGSLFRLTYDLTLKNASEEKDFIDKLRCRNGNLEISVSKQVTQNGEL